MSVKTLDWVIDSVSQGVYTSVFYVNTPGHVSAHVGPGRQHVGYRHDQPAGSTGAAAAAGTTAIICACLACPELWCRQTLGWRRISLFASSIGSRSSNSSTSISWWFIDSIACACILCTGLGRRCLGGAAEPSVGVLPIAGFQRGQEHDTQLK